MKKAKLRTCASCEWIFNSGIECPKCQFGSYGAYYVYGNKAYRYAKTQKPWKNKKIFNFEMKLTQEIKLSINKNMLLENIIDFESKQQKHKQQQDMDNLKKAMDINWPNRAHPMVPTVPKTPGIFASLWIHSTQEQMDVLGPFKTVEQAITTITDQMDPDELEFVDPTKLQLRRPSNDPLSALEFGEDEVIYLITKDFIPTVDMVFSHPPTRAPNTSHKVKKLQDEIAEIEGRIKFGKSNSFDKKRLQKLIDQLVSHQR